MRPLRERQKAEMLTSDELIGIVTAIPIAGGAISLIVISIRHRHRPGNNNITQLHPELCAP
jgi:hypothetical protein